jgi:hypothetical protein
MFRRMRFPFFAVITRHTPQGSLYPSLSCILGACIDLWCEEVIQSVCCLLLAVTLETSFLACHVPVAIAIPLLVAAADWAFGCKMKLPSGILVPWSSVCRSFQRDTGVPHTSASSSSPSMSLECEERFEIRTQRRKFTQKEVGSYIVLTD